MTSNVKPVNRNNSIHYNNVQCAVRVNNDLTPWFEVEAGVKQGCILLPTLFSVYINDLADRINAFNCGLQIDDIHLSILLYVDDIALLAPDENSLQQMLDVVSDWCSSWKLSININKTKIIHFRSKSHIRSNYIFRCNNNIVDYCDSYKYLGVWMDEFLTFTINATAIAKCASRALGALMSKVANTGGMTHKVYTKLYTSTVEPILKYGSGIWGTKQFNCISAIQNRACKFYLSVGKNCSNIATRGDMGWTSCLSKQRINTCRLMCRLLRTDENRKCNKVLKWISRRRKGWTFEVGKTISKVNARAIIEDLSISTKTAMHSIKEKINELDNTEWYDDLYNDRSNVQNGNK